MAEKETLIQKFAKKHFTNTPSHMLRSINAGKFLYSYFVPGAEVPEDPVTLLNLTQEVMLSNSQNLSDEDFVRAMMQYVLSNPGLISFEMIADLLESNAYQSLNRPNDVAIKGQFEDWLANHSMLAHLDLMSSFEVFYNINSIKRTTAALGQGGLNDNEYVNKINQQLEDKKHEFDETFVNHADEDAFEKLVTIIKNTNLSYTDKLKSIYRVLCDEEHADFLSNELDAITMGAENSKTRNAMLEGAGLTANKILYAFAKRNGWSKEKFKQIYLKFPVEQRAEQFEEHMAQLGGAQQTATKVESQSNDETTESAVNLRTENVSNETSDELVDEPNQGNRPQVKFNPVFDVVKTFGITLGGATAISAIAAIPGVGSLVGPVLGITTVVTAGVVAGITNFHKAKSEAQKKGEKLKKTDAAKIALKTGLAMMGKATPYALAMALGPKWRAVGASLMMVKSTFHDLERRANLQRQAVEQLEMQAPKQTKGIRARLENFFDRCKTIVHNVKGSDVIKSMAYGAAKGAAVYIGGQMGRELGHVVGSNVTISHQDGIHVDVNTAQMKEDFSETKLGKFAGNVKSFGEKNIATIAANEAMGHHGLDITDENVARLHNIGRVDLTDNARATAYVENNSQYINGDKHIWYNAQEQKIIIETLEEAGVEDPYGVLRVLGSAERFEVAGEIENSGFHETMTDLKNHTLNDKGVNNIFKALGIINREGGLGRIVTSERFDLAQEPVAVSRVDNYRFDDQISQTATVVEKQPDPISVSRVDNNRFDHLKNEITNNESIAVSEPTIEERPAPVSTSRVDNGRIAAYAASMTLEDQGNDHESVNIENHEDVDTVEDNQPVKLSSVSNDRFGSGVKEEPSLNEDIANENMADDSVEPISASRVDNDRFKAQIASSNDIVENLASTADDVTAIDANAETPAWVDDGSYAATVYQDLVNKCDYAGPTLDGSYSFTDKDGTYYEINPVTHEMHVDRITVDGRADTKSIDLTDNQVTEGILNEHAYSADVIGQNLAHAENYNEQEVEILELSKAAHEILADPNSSFVDRQRATVQLEKLNAWLQDIEASKTENSIPDLATEEQPAPIEPEEVETIEETSAPTNENEKLSEFKPGLFDNLKFNLKLDDIREEDEIKLETPVEDSVQTPGTDNSEPKSEITVPTQEQPNFGGEFTSVQNMYGWDL